MTDTFGVSSVYIEDEMKQSYLDYAMSVIVGRALPDARDGLKPVHRRVLYAMNEVGNDSTKPYKKSARIVGDILGKYHPHGDTAVYDTMVRLAQSFSMRYTLIDGQGNFGSIDGDSPAAMRYTEVRMSKIADEVLADLDKDTVDFIANYDDSEHEPVVLPTKIPLLLVNGSSGIAVGMATNIPPHNLVEVLNACIAMIDNPNINIFDLMSYLSGPDFPTGGFIIDSIGIYDAYTTGKGKIHIRARCHFEHYGNNGRVAIIVTELPYQVNKAKLLEKIVELVKDGKLAGISGLRDESDRHGMRMVIELKKNVNPEVTLFNLYKQTNLQTSFGINMVAIVDGGPRCMTLYEIISIFINHRREVVTRRTVNLLDKAKERAHILEGLAVALKNINKMISIIKASKNQLDAKLQLISRPWPVGDVGELFKLSNNVNLVYKGVSYTAGLHDGYYTLTDTQAQSILELRLNRLTGLEQDKIISEYQYVLETINGYLAILNNDNVLMSVIRTELTQVQLQYGDKRKSEIIRTALNTSREELINEEDRIVTMSHEGYIKAQALSDYKAQRRGGRGKSAMSTKESDYVNKFVVTNTHDTLLCFSSLGKVYWIKVYELPLAGSTAKGKPINNILPLSEGEYINTILPIREYTEDKHIFMVTKFGVVKKTVLSEFNKPRNAGLIAIDLRDGDILVNVAITNGSQNVLLFNNVGRVVCFNESEVRSMARTTMGVSGMRLKDGEVITSLIVATEGTVLTITENGYGKRTKLEEFTCHSRGCQGMVAAKTSTKNGLVVDAILVNDTDEIMVISDGGTILRTPVENISVFGRNTQGVVIIKLEPGEKVIGVNRVDTLNVDEDIKND